MLRVVIMGVSGCGKSVLAEALASDLGATFIEGDDLHPPANIEKMAAGMALTDADRAPFLDNVAAALTQGNAVASCSALKRAYRDRIRARAGATFFVLPDVSRLELERRITGRPGHFMPASLLASQLATLEPPKPDEWAIIIDGTLSTTAQVQHIRDALNGEAAA